MEQKIFDIINSDNVSKIQVGEDLISLNDEERKRVLKLLNEVKESKVLFPDGLKGICLVYDDGLIAVNISLSKINLTGSRYLLFIYHKTPKSLEFDANTFMVTNEILDKYIERLSR